MLYESKKIALVTSLEDTVATFRNKLGALFSGKIPNEVSAFDNEGMLLKMEDSSSLKHYHLLCFQTIFARFLSSDARKDTSVSTISHAATADDEPSSLPHPHNQHAAHAPVRAMVSEDSENIRHCIGMFFQTPDHFRHLQFSLFVFVASAFIKFIDFISGCKVQFHRRNFSNSQVWRWYFLISIH